MIYDSLRGARSPTSVEEIVVSGAKDLLDVDIFKAELVAIQVVHELDQPIPP